MFIKLERDGGSSGKKKGQEEEQAENVVRRSEYAHFTNFISEAL